MNANLISQIKFLFLLTFSIRHGHLEFHRVSKRKERTKNPTREPERNFRSHGVARKLQSLPRRRFVFSSVTAVKFVIVITSTLARIQFLLNENTVDLLKTERTLIVIDSSQSLIIYNRNVSQ